MNISRWLLYDDNLDKYSIIEVSKLLKTFLSIIPLVAIVLAVVNFSIGLANIGFTILTVPLFCLFSYFALSRGMINLSIIILISILITANTLSCTLGNGVHETGIIVLPVIVLFSSLVMNVKGIIITTATVIICLAYIVFGEKYGLYPTRNVASVRWVDLVVVQVITIIHIFVTYSFSNITKRNLQRVKVEFQNQKKYRNEIENNLKEKTELLRLVHHRVKNNLLLISSLIEMESHKEPKSKDRLSQLTKSINTIARAHDPLYHTEDYKQVEIQPYFEKLAATFIQSTGFNNISLEIENHFVSHETALLMGIVLQRMLGKLASISPNKIALSLSKSVNIIQLEIASDNSQLYDLEVFAMENQIIEKMGGEIHVNPSSIMISFKDV